MGRNFGFVGIDPPTAALDGIGHYDFRLTVTSSAELGEGKLQERVTLLITFDEPKSLNAVDRLALSPLRDLLSFGLGQSAGWIKVVLRSPSRAQAVGPHTHLVDMELVRRYLHHSGSEEKLMHPDLMLFSLADFPTGWQGLLERWIPLADEARAALSILLGIRYAPPQYVDIRLGLLLQAAEAYHRARLPSRAVSANSERSLALALAAVPEEVQDWLRLRLRHSTEPSLRVRLGDLIRRAHPAISALVPRRDPLAKRLSDVRHLYAHYGADPRAPEGIELYRLCERLDWVLRINLLCDLGWQASEIEALLGRNREFQHLAGRQNGPPDYGWTPPWLSTP